MIETIHVNSDHTCLVALGKGAGQSKKEEGEKRVQCRGFRGGGNHGDPHLSPVKDSVPLYRGVIVLALSSLHQHDEDDCNS